MVISKMSVEFDPVGKGMIISSTAKIRPLLMSGNNGDITHSKIISSNLNHMMIQENVLFNHENLCMKQKLAIPL